MFVLALEVDGLIAESRSLKDKRAVIRSVVDGARRRYGVASAEVGHLDLHQRCLLGFAAVAGSTAQVTKVIDEVERFVWSFPELEIVQMERSWLS